MYLFCIKKFVDFKNTNSIFRCFLSIKNPITDIIDDGSWHNGRIMDYLHENNLEPENKNDNKYINLRYNSKIESTKILKKILKNKAKYDGIYYLNRYEFSNRTEKIKLLDGTRKKNKVEIHRNKFINESDEIFKKYFPQAKYSWIAFYPYQIKLADGSNTTFDKNNPDIRYRQGGKVKNYWYKGLFKTKYFNL